MVERCDFKILKFFQIVKFSFREFAKNAVRFV